MKLDKLEDEETGILFRMRTKEKGKHFGIPTKHEIVLRRGGKLRRNFSLYYWLLSQDHQTI